MQILGFGDGFWGLEGATGVRFQCFWFQNNGISAHKQMQQKNIFLLPHFFRVLDFLFWIPGGPWGPMDLKLNNNYLCINTQRFLTVIVFLYGFIFNNCWALLFGLCHLMSLMVFGLILQKICVQIINADNSDCKKKKLGNNAGNQFFGLNIFHAGKVSWH
jgi:hypothetical protein